MCFVDFYIYNKTKFALPQYFVCKNLCFLVFASPLVFSTCGYCNEDLISNLKRPFKGFIYLFLEIFCSYLILGKVLNKI